MSHNSMPNSGLDPFSAGSTWNSGHEENSARARIDDLRWALHYRTRGDQPTVVVANPGEDCLSCTATGLLQVPSGKESVAQERHERSASILTSAASGEFLTGNLRAPVVRIGSGTGFVVAPGVILTCAHVVEAQKMLTPARVVGVDSFADIAVVMVDKPEPTEVVRLLEHWNDLAVGNVPAIPVASSANDINVRTMAVNAARCAVRAAYIARAAVVQEHPSLGRPIVAEFAARWLGLKPTDENIEATCNALLHLPLDGEHPDSEHAAVGRLRVETARQLRAMRCIGATERAVAVAFAEGAAATWAEAATNCGYSAELGERVRRKLRREGSALTLRSIVGR
jgi:hypothetical protein